MPLLVHHIQLQIVRGRAVSLELLGDVVHPGVGVVEVS